MNVYAWVLLTALAVAAGAGWVAVATRRRDVETITRPAFFVVLIALAWLLQADTVDYGRFLLLGLICWLVGEVLLLGEAGWHLVGRLVAFALGLAAYLVAVCRMPSEGPLWLGVILVVLAVGLALWRWIWPDVRRSPAHGLPLLGYAAIVGAVAACAWGSGDVVVALGATFVLASGALIGYQLLERRLSGGPVTVLASYQVGQLLIVLGMLRG